MKDQEILQKLKENVLDPCNSSNMCNPCENCKDLYRQIINLMEEGHTNHCAWRMVSGDGQCECKKQGIIPGPISKEMVKSQCN